MSTVRVLNTTFSKSENGDGEVDAKLKMEEVFNEDKAAGRMPILCIANVHSSLFQVYRIELTSVFILVYNADDDGIILSFILFTAVYECIYI